MVTFVGQSSLLTLVLLVWFRNPDLYSEYDCGSEPIRSASRFLVLVKPSMTIVCAVHISSYNGDRVENYKSGIRIWIVPQLQNVILYNVQNIHYRYVFINCLESKYQPKKVCDYCGYTFVGGENILIHMQEQHADQLFLCSCSKSFPRSVPLSLLPLP